MKRTTGPIAKEAFLIDATGWTEEQIALYLELEAAGYLKDGKLTEAGRDLLGRTGYFPQVTNINNDPRFRRIA